MASDLWAAKEGGPTRRSRLARLGTAATAAGAALAMFGTAAGANPPNPPPAYVVHHGPDGTTDVNVCSYDVPAGTARCFARVRTDSQARNEKPSSNAAGPNATLGNGGAYDPAYLESAYNDPWFVGSSTKSTAGTGQTVAIIDAYDDPNAESDTGYYRSFFGLPSCTTANGCFRKVNETGGTNYPPGNSSWAQETSLDLDMVSAVCPNCHILLVEAQTSSIADLGTAANEAVSLGANVVSNSYGSSEYSAEVNDSTSYYDHPGVAVVASSGDNGYGVSFPAASPTVTSAGGTTLNQATNTGTRSATETVWSGAGSGCSSFEPKPTWQTDSCTHRTVADTSAVANPSTGVWVYDTDSASGWNIFGGTSVASPIVSSFYALAGNPTGSSDVPASYLYGHISNLNQVRSGSNGTCGNYLCNAADSLVDGYNGPTGLGTPNGVPAFTAAPANPNLPGAPTGVSALAGNAQATVSFTSPTNTGTTAISSFTVTATDGTNPSHGGQSASGPSSPIAVTGLTNGDSYTFTVTATNLAGNGPASAPSSPVVPYTVPGAPTGVSAQAGNAQATVTFTAPNNGGSTITSYRATATDSTTLANGSEMATGSVSPITVKGLTNGDSYTFTVTATNLAGTGMASAPSSPVVPTAAATVPSAPQNVSAKTDASKGTDLSWNAPASNGGSSVTSYTVFRSTRSGSESAYTSVNCASSSCTFHDSNTRRGTVYYYEVAAVNAVGTGPRSSEVHATAR